MRFRFLPISSTSRSTKTRSPPASLDRQRTNHSACQNKPGFSCVSLQAQYQAFVRFAVASSAALSAIALNSTCVLEPFHPARLSP
jgi:hypothetical protein